MARISAPLDTTIPPPLLITGDQLFALDRILGSFADRLNEEQERQIQSAIEREVTQLVKTGYPSDKAEDLGRRYADTRRVNRRSVTIYLRGGRTVEGRNFSEAVTLPNVTEEIALGFRASLEVAKTKATIDFGFGWLGG